MNKNLQQLHLMLGEHHLASAKMHKACANCEDTDRAAFHKGMAAHHADFAAAHLVCAKALEVDRGGAGSDVPTGDLDGADKTISFRPGFAAGSLMEKAVGFDQMLNGSVAKVQGTLVSRSGGPDATATLDRFRR